jgi:hypothetical protein
MLLNFIFENLLPFGLEIFIVFELDWFDGNVDMLFIFLVLFDYDIFASVDSDSFTYFFAVVLNELFYNSDLPK